MKYGPMLTVLWLIAIVPVAPANAALIKVLVDGTLDRYSDPDMLLPFDEPLPGTSFRLAFTYDDATPDSATSGQTDMLPDIGSYHGAVDTATLRIGSFIADALPLNRITVLNDALADDGGGNSFRIDLWEMQTTDSPILVGEADQTLTEGFGFNLLSQFPAAPGGPLDSDALLPPDWSSWTGASIFYRVQLTTPSLSGAPSLIETVSVARANVTGITVVPAPATVWLLVSGLATLACRARKKVAASYQLG